jgi:hypothetical protein
VKLYCSNIFKKMPDITRQERREWIVEIVDALGDLKSEETNRLGIHSVDISPYGDITVGYRTATEAERHVDQGVVVVDLARGVRCVIPTAPVVEQGTINHRRYLVKARGQAGVSHLQVCQLLIAQGYHIVHTEMESHENDAIDFGINANGMTLFLEFPSIQEALEMRDIYWLDGHEVRLWHKGRFQ